MIDLYTLIWSNTAKYDLESIVDYISKDSPLNAKSVLNKIKDRLSLLSSNPSQGRIVPELKTFGIMQYREIIIDPWRIIYRIADSTVFVMAVIDARRNVEDLLLERLVRR